MISRLDKGCYVMEMELTEESALVGRYEEYQEAVVVNTPTRVKTFHISRTIDTIGRDARSARNASILVDVEFQ